MVYTHPFVLGEICLGSLSRRAEVLTNLKNLSHAPVAADLEVVEMIDKRKLYGKGIGHIDAHLVASVILSGRLLLWMNDKRLNDVAVELGLARTT